MTGIFAHIVVVIVTLAALAAAFMVLQQRRTPQSAVAWLLFIVLVPYLALPLFLALGIRKQGSRYAPIRFAAERPENEESSAAALFESLGAPPPSENNRVRIVRDGGEAREALWALLESAHSSLDIIFYALNDDVTGREFLRRLANRARHGVRVRLILDRFGAWSIPRGDMAAFTAAGGQLQYHTPFIHSPNRGHVNLRNHRKIAIADGRSAFTGGRNVGVSYLGATGVPAPWEDLSVLLEGGCVHYLQDVFRSDWAVVTGRPTVPNDELKAKRTTATGGKSVVQVVPSGPDLPNDVFHDGLTVAIHQAKQRVWIATPYFLPTESLSMALGLAARRGIDVRILIPETSNQRLTDFARGAYLRNLYTDGCQILRYRPSMMHAKAGLIDMMAWVGTANFDVRSMLLNFELAVIFHDQPTVAQLEEWFLDMQADCDKGLEPSSPLRRGLDGLFRLSAPIL